MVLGGVEMIDEVHVTNLKDLDKRLKALGKKLDHSSELKRIADALEHIAKILKKKKK